MTRPDAVTGTGVGTGALPGSTAAGRFEEFLDTAALVTLTQELVRADSVNPGGTEGAAAEVLARACRERGLTVDVVEVAPGRPNVIATLPPDAASPGAGSPDAEPSHAAPGLMFLGHSDVVPVGPGWTRDPFGGEHEDDRVWGRGSTDMKGGLAAVLVAIDAIARSGIPRRAPLTLVCTVDEEEIGLGVRDLVSRPLPGGWSYAGCIVAEPTDLEIVIACRGDSYLEVEVTGVPAHSGRPADGRNAIDAAARILDLVRADHAAMAADPDPLIGAGTWNPGLISGGQGTSMVAPDCRLSLDRRLMPDEDADALREDLLRRIDDAGITGDGITVDAQVVMSMPGFRTPPDAPIVSWVQESGADLGLTLPVGGWTAACDGGFVSRDFDIPALVCGPGDLNAQAHKADESVGVEELRTAARLFAAVAARVVSADTAPGVGGDRP